MTCNNCKKLETRIEELRLQNLEIEERRSRERVRFAKLNEQMIFKSRRLDEPDSVPSKQDFIDLLELLNRVVQDPSSECLRETKAQLEKYIL